MGMRKTKIVCTLGPATDRDGVLRELLLAGGASRRFGGDKLTADFHGKPLYLYALEALSYLKDHPVRVVTRNREIGETAQRMGFFPVEAPPPDEGVAASVRAGVMACRPDAFLCFFVCDQPWFSGKEFQAFLTAFQASGKAYGRVCCGSRMGSPTIFPPPVAAAAILSSSFRFSQSALLHSGS